MALAMFASERTPELLKLEVALPPKYAAPKFEKLVDDALEKRWRAVQALESTRSVVEADPTVIDPPALKVVPLMVPREPVRRLVPMDEVATRRLLASSPRSEDAASDVKYTVEVAVNCEVEAFEKRLVPVHQLLLARIVEEAAVIVMSAVPLNETLLMLRAFWSAVAVPAFPLIEPVIVFENVLVPEKVLSLARSVDDAAVTVTDPPAVTAVPLTVARVPERRLVPIVVVETTFPVESVARRPLVIEVNQTELVAVSIEVEAFVKRLVPVYQLESARSVVDAAPSMMEPPTLKATLLMVPSEPVRRLVPIVVEAMTWPAALVDRRAFAIFASESWPALLNDDVAEPPKYESPKTERRVDEAKTSPESEVMSVLAPAAAAPRLVRAPEAVEAPVPPR